MQFYRPLWPQHRLSSSLINRHEYDFSPILAELPKDSKVASKIMNFTVDITKDLMQEKVGLMEKKEREKLDLTKDLKREKLDLTKDLMEKKERKVELSKHITNLENEVKHRIELLLRSKRMCNLKLNSEQMFELIMSRIDELNNKFEYFENLFFVVLLMLPLRDVERCMGGLYHTASKKLHGHDKDIEIDARDWSVNEVLALGVLLRYYNISYSYYDDQGELAEYPYKLAEYP
ncbi:13756_t:CDS:2 [Gigaspora margarita]|uniref:13756_t:CDS:1 n=1 Tax=Gigaspora margarita TaxID=4874 RepID=A0ABN7VMC8_GIGMA|nr:13756_t:CDS:2 [Gigaspora margarita]